MLILMKQKKRRLFDMLGSAHVERMTMPWYVSSHTTINLTLSVGEETKQERSLRVTLRKNFAHFAVKKEVFFYFSLLVWTSNAMCCSAYR
jgi:hypothetical protein